MTMKSIIASAKARGREELFSLGILSKVTDENNVRDLVRDDQEKKTERCKIERGKLRTLFSGLRYNKRSLTGEERSRLKEALDKKGFVGQFQ